jgi:prevent-host-death family protein
MTEVASRELRNDTASLLRRVESGEEITITVRGRPVAVLRPIREGRPRWLARDEFLSRLHGAQTDAGLDRELRELNPETTDDMPFR